MKKNGKDTGACALDHIAIAVEDLEEAIELYSGLLGLTVAERRETRGVSTGMISAVLTGAGIPIVLVQGLEPESQVTRFIRKHGAGVQHLAFNVEDLDEKVGRFLEAGVQPAFPSIDGDGIRQIFLCKLESGPRIELIERSGGTFNDSSIEKLFLSMEERNLT